MYIEHKLFEIILKDDNTDHELVEIKHISTKTIRMGIIRTNPRIEKWQDHEYTAYDEKGGYDATLYYVCDDGIVDENSKWRLLSSDLILHAHNVIEE
jgi:hypothetical protein